ncbi:ABC-three component system protein, partial [Streptomyces sp. NPDC002889]|uniref:ABC-three component system protein n=1 Tax=Streptomyces sp. NPDC002889 TaxID=3364669 RepID=UPI00369D38F1
LSDGTTFEHGEWLTEKEKTKLLRLEQRAARRQAAPQARRAHQPPAAPHLRPDRRTARETVLSRYVRPLDRKGVCHHLANDGRLTWCEEAA